MNFMIFFLVAGVGLWHAVKAADDTMIIGLIGDSTVAITYGWGPAFADKVDDRVKVLNYAKNGATLDSLSKKMDALMSAKPVFVLIQFGHNDMKQYDAESYGRKLRGYVERVTDGAEKPSF